MRMSAPERHQILALLIRDRVRRRVTPIAGLDAVGLRASRAAIKMGKANQLAKRIARVVTTTKRLVLAQITPIRPHANPRTIVTGGVVHGTRRRAHLKPQPPRATPSPGVRHQKIIRALDSLTRRHAMPKRLALLK